MHQYKIIEKGSPVEKASGALIMLHGRGGSAYDILGLAEEFTNLDAFYIAAPQATNNAWYPYSFLEEEKKNEPWLSSAVDIVRRTIDATVRFIPKSKIFIVGFSQGACLALEAASRHADKFGGIAAFTGGLIGKSIDETKYHGNFAGTKVFLGNSDRDPHVPLIRSEQSKEIMEKMGAEVTLKIYPGMAHTINQDEINWVNTHFFYRMGKIGKIDQIPRPRPRPRPRP